MRSERPIAIEVLAIEVLDEELLDGELLGVARWEVRRSSGAAPSGCEVAGVSVSGLLSGAATLADHDRIALNGALLQGAWLQRAVLRPVAELYRREGEVIPFGDLKLAAGHIELPIVDKGLLKSYRAGHTLSLD
jgi:hypothetical protein